MNIQLKKHGLALIVKNKISDKKKTLTANDMDLRSLTFLRSCAIGHITPSLLFHHFMGEMTLQLFFQRFYDKETKFFLWPDRKKLQMCVQSFYYLLNSKYKKDVYV